MKLSAEQGNLVYIPKELAHGFCAMSHTATLIYKVSTVYDQKKIQASFGIRSDLTGQCLILLFLSVMPDWCR
ncbi:MAG: dTDP-4-dehydrorhamnose 3,5-epimerase family protein [Flammeovirgaceae bacterium]